MRGKWDMSFAVGGEIALKALNEGKFDVVVSDMRMPGMDGAEVMGHVRNLQPDSFRIILSGETDETQFVRTVGPAHQYLSKPCDGETLIETIETGMNLRLYVGNDPLRSMLGGVETLPMPNDVLFKVIEELDSECADARNVAAIIERDVGLTTQVLRFANSAFFSIPIEVTSPQQAVNVLGFDSIRAMVLSAGIFNVFSVSKSEENELRRLAQNSYAIGTLAQALAEAEGMDTAFARNALCAGCVSHIGTLLLRSYFSDIFKQSVEICEQGELTMHEAEHQLLGNAHGALGGYLLGLWGFNDYIIEAVAYHHEPRQAGHAVISPLTFVHVAQHLCAEMNKNRTQRLPSHYTLDEAYLEQTGLIPRLDAWREIAASTLTEKEASNG